jgi:hypothetical protein
MAAVQTGALAPGPVHHQHNIIAVNSVTVVSNGHCWLLCLSDYGSGANIMNSHFFVSVTVIFDFWIVERTVMGCLSES